MKVLIVEDEKKTAEYLRQGFLEQGYSVDIALDGIDGLHLALHHSYDVILLDAMLPGMDGFGVLRALRATRDTPVLMLTARDGTADRIRGLRDGADDYLVKPFSTEELLARLRALSRRQSKELTENIVTVGNLTLNPIRCEALVSGKPIRLTVKESLLLELLMRNAGQVITKERILYKVWSYTSDIELANVDLYIHYLRKKLPGPCIKTIRGVGYCLQEVNHVPPTSS